MFVCVSVIVHNIPKNDAAGRIIKLDIQNVTTSPEDPFVFGSKGQGHESPKTVAALRRVLYSSTSMSVFKRNYCAFSSCNMVITENRIFISYRNFSLLLARHLVNAYEMHAEWLIPFVDKRVGGR